MDCPTDTVTMKPWTDLTPEEVYAIARLRTEVFLREQQCDDEELDGRDLEPTTEHWWTGVEGDAAPTAPTTYLRVLRNEDAEIIDGLPTAHLVIGRVVTDPEHRGRGLASRLLAAVIERHGNEPMMLHAQFHARQLYVNVGFAPVGEIFDEAGIDHITMVRPAD